MECFAHITELNSINCNDDDNEVGHVQVKGPKLSGMGGLAPAFLGNAERKVVVMSSCLALKKDITRLSCARSG